MPPIFSPAHLEAICKVLGDTTTGLTGAEIGRCLQQVGVTDNDPALTKWMRLYDALAARHNKDGHGDRVLAFIKVALDPPRYIGKADLFEMRCDAVNVCLAFHGLAFREDGKFHRTTVATTLSEAEDRAKRLRTALEPRGIHPDVIRYCRAEFLQNNCFHAVLEASKSVAEKLRQKSGFTSDGAELVDAALGGQDPLLRINGFSTENEKSEQRGFVNLAKGLFGTFRNPTAHAPRIEWPLSEQDALDLFALASYVHRRVDTATKR